MNIGHDIFTLLCSITDDQAKNSDADDNLNVIIKNSTDKSKTRNSS